MKRENWKIKNNAIGKMVKLVNILYDEVTKNALEIAVSEGRNCLEIKDIERGYLSYIKTTYSNLND